MPTSISKDKFLEEFQDIIQRDDPVSPDDLLENIEEWDSMAIMACIAWFDSALNIKLPYKTVAGLQTVQQLIEKANGAIG